MKNYNNQKINQLIFVEYEKPTKTGHLITVVDSYHNTIGRIHRSFNEESKRYEYQAVDHTGKPVAEKSEKLWEMKNHFTSNREVLLKEAHERRLESKAQSQEQTQGKEQKDSQNKKDVSEKSEKAKSVKDKEFEKEDPKPVKGQEKQSEFSSRQSHYDMDLSMEDVTYGADERENELENLRENNADRDSRFER